ncbi:SRPBCC family protein [Roseibium aggregatum]|uniref:Polyketide cyclase n=1 Tax=Roseibium aggregatum TaxID=187304 RepID=A0A926S6U0_9HYPH|nr:SRPBCC family protein [Roseibium aggregatum]MBD1547926.1 polyketide cyclase [Roseibium aggregatum]
MTERGVVHAMFTLERTYRASRRLLFEAFADFDKKRKWFGGPDGTSAASMDFRIGGREHSHGVVEFHDHSHSYRFDSIYLDIVEDERIIYAYDMDADGRHVSASLTTIELFDVPGGTRLKFTEQGAFLDGYDGPQMREDGTRDLLDALGRVVEA